MFTQVTDNQYIIILKITLKMYRFVFINAVYKMLLHTHTRTHMRTVSTRQTLADFMDCIYSNQVNAILCTAFRTYLYSLQSF